MKIKLLTATLMILSGALLFSSEQPQTEPKEQIVYENGQKFIIREVYLNTDFKKKYEELQAKWDKREQQHAEESDRLRSRMKVDNEAYERIEELLGMRLWTQSSDESLQRQVADKARRVYPSDEMVMEYSFLFKNYPEDGAGLKSTRRGYALLLLELGKVEQGMTLKEIESVIGEPNDAIEVDDAEFIVYNMYPNKKHALLLEIEGKKVSEIYFGDRDGSNLKLWELHPQLRN